MTRPPDFTVRVDQNPHLPPGGRETHAVVTVRAHDAGTGHERAPAAQVILIDTSGSMSYQGKMAAAKRAARAAVDVLRDGVRFAVVAGANRPRMIYPQGERLVAASESTRRGAAQAVEGLAAAGGTAIGSWLRLADRLFTEYENAVPQERAIKHAILLTDGRNQHETPEELDAALRHCAGRFQCDARGVGTDWEVAEVRRITSALLGGFLDVPDPADLEAGFRAMAGASMSKRVADVSLRLWTPRQARLRFVRQMIPAVQDLTGRRVESGTQTGDYPLGAWGHEEREYHVCVEVEPADVGRRMRAAQLRLLVGDEVRASGNVLAEWTGDETRASRVDPRVAHHARQSELADAVREGLEARRRGAGGTATARLGRAVVLARQAGNEQLSDLLHRVVEVLDPVRGTVRLKRNVAKADEMSLDTRAVRTVRPPYGDFQHGDSQHGDSQHGDSRQEGPL